ncbi:MAG: hypothetical protein WCF36_15720 [Candidatus Nanopelagicales bacterium]
MSRTFWAAVGAVGGVIAYRKATQAAHRAKELGPLGSAQVAAQATSRMAGRTAHSLGRLQEVKARREGRLLRGQAQELDLVPAPQQATGPAAGPVPDGWVPAPGPGAHLGAEPGRAATAPTTDGSR